MSTTGIFVREALIRAGDRGVVPADLFRERKANYLELGLRKPTGILHSFEVFFSILKRLGWVQKTGVEEAVFRKGSVDELNPNKIYRKYYRITPEGLAQPETAWSNPIITLMRLYPERYPKAIDGRYKRHKSKVILDRESKRFLIEPE